MTTDYNMLEELTTAIGVPGNEREARDVMKKYITPYAEEVYTDGLGSLIARKTGDANGPKVMLAGHLDEIGLMVTQITDEGFLRFQTLGGWWNQVMLGQRMTVATRKGNLMGVVGSKPPHIVSAEERNKPYAIKDMFIDIGATSKEEAESFGVRPGDSVVPICPFTEMANPKLLMAKAWDNRIGCAIAIEVLKRLEGKKHPNTVFGVGTIQEEVGSRGAKTATRMIDPDLMIAIDTGIAGDTPGITPNEAQSKIGKGPQLMIYDSSMVPHKGLRDFVADLAEENDIPFQYEALNGGGTDAGSAHLIGNGVPSLALTIPTRYIHTAASIIHVDDFEYTVQLLVKLLEKMDHTTLQGLLP